MKYRIQVNKQIASSVRWVEALPIGEPMNFVAGQYAQLQINNQSIPLSIANAPTADGKVSFLIREAAADALQQCLLMEMATKREINITGPYGNCRYVKDQSKNVVLLARGVGMGQAKSIIEQFALAADTREISLYWSMRKAHQGLLHAHLQHWKQKLNFNYFIFYKQDSVIPAHVRALDRLLNDIKSFKECTVYISGPWTLTDEALPELLRRNAKKSNIYSDRFAFYDD